MVIATLTLERLEGTGPDWCHWELPETGISIRLSLEVVDRLEREALESFRAITKRGSEIGGLLLGQVSPDPHAIRITDYEPVVCDYNRGPLYQLSEADEKRLEAAIARPRESLSVVGFFRSNTRKELALDANDVAVIERYFPSRDSLALLVKPFSMKPSLGGFFLREEGQTSPLIEFTFRRSELGKDRPVAERTVARPEPPDGARCPARTEQAIAPASVEVTGDRVAMDLRALDKAMAAPESAEPAKAISSPVAAAATVASARKEQATTPASVGVTEGRVAVDLRALDKAMATPEPAKPVASPLPVEVLAAPAPAPPQEAVPAAPHREPDTAAHPARRSRRWLWLPLLAAALGGGGYLGYRLNGPLLPAPAPPGGALSLSVERHAGQLRLGWNRSAPVVAQAQRAALSITDGTQEQNLDLDLGQLRTGSLVYTPSSSDVVFRLEVTDLKNGKSVTESIRAVAGRPSPLGSAALTLPELAPARAAAPEPPPEAEPPAVAPPGPSERSTDGPTPPAPKAAAEPTSPSEATPPR